jgi:hypothetical protein
MHFRFLALAALILLLGGMTVSSQAQLKLTYSPRLVDDFGDRDNSEVVANEISAGTVERSNVVYGWTFSGQTKGDLSGNIFMSVNYANDINAIGVDNAVRENSPLNNVSGGAWSKMIYVDGAYAGSLSGTIAGGSMNWNPEHTIATFELQLICDNGTVNFAGVTGSGTFTGTLDRANGGAVTGTLTLNY